MPATIIKNPAPRRLVAEVDGSIVGIGGPSLLALVVIVKTN
jgi:hypothetical protein